MNKFLDYSQFDSFMKCEAFWWERYRAQYEKAPRSGQKSDARTLGSLVHEGLDNFRTTGVPTISEERIARYNPTPECLTEAIGLVNGYTLAYPNETYTKYYCEEPLKFPLLDTMDGLAKIDSYFNLGEPISRENGLGDYHTLEAGWWIDEYKTKAASKDVGKYVGSWRMNMQASFQMLALAELVGEMPRGVIVNVLEKPAEYTPIRTCRACKARVELRNWQPTGDGYRCPECENVQELDTSDKSKKVRAPKFYRIMVQRNIKELERARVDMKLVAETMLEMDQSFTDRGDPYALRRTNSCIDQIWGECEYFGPHSEGLAANQYGGFVPIESLAYVTK